MKKLMENHSDIFCVVENGTLAGWLDFTGTIDAPQFPTPNEYFLKAVELGRRTRCVKRKELAGHRFRQEQREALIKGIKRS